MWTARCNPADRDGNPVRSMYASNVATSSSDKLTLSFTPLCYQGSSQVATIGIRPASTGDWSPLLGLVVANCGSYPSSAAYLARD